MVLQMVKLLRVLETRSRRRSARRVRMVEKNLRKRPQLTGEGKRNRQQKYLFFSLAHAIITFCLQHGWPSALHSMKWLKNQSCK